MKPENIIYFKLGNQVENTGDALINKQAIKALREHGKVIVISKCSSEGFIAEIAMEQDGVVSNIYTSLVKDLLVAKFKKRERKRIWLFFPPGHDSKDKGFAALAAIKTLFSLILLRMLGCHIARTGVSLGNMNLISGKLESLASRMNCYYGLRDSESLSLAKKYKFKNYDFFPDYSWAYKKVSSETVELGDRDEKSSASSSPSYIILSFRSNSFGQSHVEGYLNPHVQIIETLLSKLQITFDRVVVCYQVDFDRIAAQELYDRFINNYNVELVDERLTISSASKLYKGASYVISNRLHVIILALLNGSMPIPVTEKEDNKKITSFLEDNGLENINIDVCSSHETVTERINYIIKNKSLYIYKLVELQKQHEKEIKNKIDSVLNLSYSPGPSASVLKSIQARD